MIGQTKRWLRCTQWVCTVHTHSLFRESHYHSINTPVIWTPYIYIVSITGIVQQQQQKCTASLGIPWYVQWIIFWKVTFHILNIVLTCVTNTQWVCTTYTGKMYTVHTKMLVLSILLLSTRCCLLTWNVQWFDVHILPMHF